MIYKIDSRLTGVKKIIPSLHKDNRGKFLETWNKKLYENLIGDVTFCQDNLSFSKKNVIRGLHLQIKKPQGKFITVLKGKIYDVVVDCRINSKTIGQYFSIILSEKLNNSLYIPEGFAHGYCSLSSESILHYKMTEYRDKKLERGILWNDKDLNIEWPIKKPIISARDKANMSFKNFIKYR